MKKTKKSKKINPNYYFKSKEEIKKFKEDNFKFFEILTYVTKFEQTFDVKKLDLDLLINYKGFIRYYLDKYLNYETEIDEEETPYIDHFLHVDHYLDMLTLDNDLMEMDDLAILRSVTSDIIDSDIFLFSFVEMFIDMMIKFKFLDYEHNLKDFKDIMSIRLPDAEIVKEIKEEMEKM